MSEEKKEHGDGCCSGDTKPVSGGGCGSVGGCGGGMKKFVCGMIVGVFIFAAGMWYTKAHCESGGCHMGSHTSASSTGMGKMCPMGGNMGGGSMMESK